ncbi:cytokine receptor-like [Cololabis saira]|uniref:cytokine receptor-like n=1 Tax=Cololabis saira TaxID=129043 RepID=UPI002AD2C759|nr:cytokine receptor-like [Cololabis saira]
MAEAGFARTPEQLKIKWKNLRTAYISAKNKNNRSGHDPASCPHFAILDDLLGGRPLSQAGQNGVDSGFPAANQEAATDMESTAETEMGGHVETAERGEEACPVAGTSQCSSPLQSNSELLEISAQRPRRRRQGSDVALLCDFWRERHRERDEQQRERDEQQRERDEQQRESDDRQERTLACFLGEIRATNRLFGAVLDSINRLTPPAPTSHPPRNSTPRPGYLAFPRPLSPVYHPQTPSTPSRPRPMTSDPEAYPGYHRALPGPSSPAPSTPSSPMTSDPEAYPGYHRSLPGPSSPAPSTPSSPMTSDPEVYPGYHGALPGPSKYRDL